MPPYQGLVREGGEGGGGDHDNSPAMHPLFDVVCNDAPIV